MLRYETESLAALEAVSSAEELLHSPAGRPVIATKESRRDVVTHFDLLLERHISSVLAATGLPVVGEEAYARERFLPADTSTFWLVDPIDGTVNFTNGIPYFAISAGLWDGEDFRVGAVSLPAFKELFFTHGDEAAFLNGRRLDVKPARLDEALVGAGFPARAGQDGQDQYEIFGRINEATRGCLRLGSAAALICLVACGRLQGAYGLGAKLWDVAGALAVAKRAGAEVRYRRYPGGPRIDYIAAAPGVGRPLREILGKGPDWGTE